jgi:hypothetical protein
MSIDVIFDNYIMSNVAIPLHHAISHNIMLL